MKNLPVLALIFSHLSALQPPLVSYTADTLDLRADAVETSAIREVLRVAADQDSIKHTLFPFFYKSEALLHDLVYDSRLAKTDPAELADALALRIPADDPGLVQTIYYHVNHPRIVPHPRVIWIEAIKRLAQARNITLRALN